MATLRQIPTPTSSNELIRVALDGSTYEFRWLWNERDDHWYFDLFTVEGTPVTRGIKVVINWNLLQDVTNSLAPQGALIAFDESTSSKSLTGADPGLNDLGDRVNIYYIDESAQEELFG